MFSASIQAANIGHLKMRFPAARALGYPCRKNFYLELTGFKPLGSKSAPDCKAQRPAHFDSFAGFVGINISKEHFFAFQAGVEPAREPSGQSRIISSGFGIMTIPSFNTPLRIPVPPSEIHIFKLREVFIRAARLRARFLSSGSYSCFIQTS